VAFYVGFLRYLLTMFSTVQGGLRRVVNMKLCETNNVSLQNSVISFHDDSLMYSTNLSARSLNNLFFGRRATC
jgi:flagellar basal body rod protein FlgB